MTTVRRVVRRDEGRAGGWEAIPATPRLALLLVFGLAALTLPAGAEEPQVAPPFSETDLLAAEADVDELFAAPASLRETGRAIDQAWLAPAETLEERVWRTRRAALERGLWNVDAPARALLATEGIPLERAEAAVLLAPDLPAAQMALARALWLHGGSPLGAIRRAFAAIASFARHPEGALWLGGSLLMVLAAGLVGGGLLCIAVAGLFSAPHAAHDLGDQISSKLPGFARAALLVSALLVLPVLGEGILGLGLGLLTIGVVYGSTRQRIALGLAGVTILAGAYPVAGLGGAVLQALPADPVAQAALAASRGFPFPSDVARLESAPEDDLVAREALARLARREGRLGQADALYQALLKEVPGNLVVANNAANVRLHLGHMESALDLYRHALSIEESPLVLYNLAQAYGRAFQVDDLTETLQRAQVLDGELVADLTRLQGTQPEGFVLDLPVPLTALWSRVLDLEGGSTLAAELRATVAPGLLGRSAPMLAGAIVLMLAAGGIIGAGLRASRWCARCGRRVCPRCHPEVSGGELCGPCHKLFYQPERTDRELRLARIEALRERESRLDKVAWLVSVILPGAAGLLARKPVAGLLGALFFALALGALFWREGAVPDPLVAGAAGPIAFLGFAALCGIGYAVVVGSSLVARRHLS